MELQKHKHICKNTDNKLNNQMVYNLLILLKIGCIEQNQRIEQYLKRYVIDGVIQILLDTQTQK